MGWEDQFARRPGAAGVTSRARVEDAAVSSDVLLETPGKADQLANAATAAPWSMRQTVGAGALFVTGLWIFCFAMSHLLIFALLRVTR